jgi:putative endonuclease
MGRGAAGQAGQERGARGQAGEALAVAWYEAHGYEVVARNWRCREGELDVVARRGRLHVFCEVKSRSSAAFGVPVEAVGHLKRARLRRLAALWFAALPAGRPATGRGGPVRFDVACVLGEVLEVIEGAL